VTDLSYPRIYLRMFVYIAAALTAFMLVGAISIFLIASYELRGYAEARHSPLAQEAADVLAAGGQEALRDWLADSIDQPRDFTIYILDAESRDLLGRPLPSELAGFIRDSVVRRATDGAGANVLDVRLTPQLVAPDGSLLSFLLLPKGVSLSGSAATRFGLLAVAVLVAAVVAWLIARAFGRPVEELQLAVRELASGHVDARVPDAIARRRDELGILAADFNRMADRLQQLISGREQLMREMSHELRSPLARLQAALALADERGSLDAGERRQVEQEIERMDQAIGEMLRFSHVDGGGAMARRLVRIRRLLADLVATEEVEAHARGCALRLAAERDLTLVGDPALLRSGFENVLRNAIRHAPPDTAVEIDARQSAGGITVTINDRGPGVAPEHLQRIFEPFFRSPDSAGTSTGSGLGLAIARRVFETHGGSVAAYARDGGGLTVVVRLVAAELT
jgi:signal transduction histidine kinase